MKKNIYGIALSITITFSCTGVDIPQVTLDDRIDSLGYALGVSKAVNIKERLASEHQIDTANIDNYMKALLSGKEESNADSCYALGLAERKEVDSLLVEESKAYLGKKPSKKLDINMMLAGMLNILTGQNLLMTADQANEYKMNFDRWSSLDIKEPTTFSIRTNKITYASNGFKIEGGIGALRKAVIYPDYTIELIEEPERTRTFQGVLIKGSFRGVQQKVLAFNYNPSLIYFITEDLGLYQYYERFLGRISKEEMLVVMLSQLNQYKKEYENGTKQFYILEKIN